MGQCCGGVRWGTPEYSVRVITILLLRAPRRTCGRPHLDSWSNDSTARPSSALYRLCSQTIRRCDSERPATRSTLRSAGLRRSSPSSPFPSWRSSEPEPSTWNSQGRRTAHRDTGKNRPGSGRANHQAPDSSSSAQLETGSAIDCGRTRACRQDRDDSRAPLKSYWPS